MKILTYFFILMIGLTLNAYPESFRKTNSDLYAGSYAAQMRQQAGLSATEVRAENYSRFYEKCDEHHDCASATAEGKKQPERKLKMESRPEAVKPLMHLPLWQ